jgi:hypothetical protein
MGGPRSRQLLGSADERQLQAQYQLSGRLLTLARNLRFGAGLQWGGVVSPKLVQCRWLHVADSHIGHERCSRLHEDGGLQGRVSGGVLLVQR